MIESLNSIDQSLFLVMNSWNASWLNPVMKFLSGQAIWTPFILYIVYLAYKQLNRKTFGLFILFLFLAIIASDVTSSYLFKNIFDRLRPCRIDEIKAVMNNFGQKCGGKYGFVSSHAANSFCILIFSFFALTYKPKYLKLLWILPVLVGFSRIYLGVHYPGDILGGIIVGCFWGYFLAWFFKNQSGGQSA